MAYNNKGNRNNNNKGNRNNKRKPEGPKILLGEYQYSLNKNEIIIKIQSNDFPFPNSIVFQNDRSVGKVDEVYGKLNESYASILIDNNFSKEIPFFCNKFLKREWLLPRNEALGEKEKKDKKKDSNHIKTPQERFNKFEKNKKERFNKFENNKKQSFDKKSIKRAKIVKFDD